MLNGHSTGAALRVAAGYLALFYARDVSRAYTVRCLRKHAAYAERAGDSDVAELATTTAADLQEGNFPVIILDGTKIAPPEGFQEVGGSTEPGGPLEGLQFDSPHARRLAETEGLTVEDFEAADAAKAAAPTGADGGWLVGDVEKVQEHRDAHQEEEEGGAD